MLRPACYTEWKLCTVKHGYNEAPGTGDFASL